MLVEWNQSPDDGQKIYAVCSKIPTAFRGIIRNFNSWVPKFCYNRFRLLGCYMRRYFACISFPQNPWVLLYSFQKSVGSIYSVIKSTFSLKISTLIHPNAIRRLFHHPCFMTSIWNALVWASWVIRQNFQVDDTDATVISFREKTSSCFYLPPLWKKNRC